ncbi:15715_t:CDS:2 [Rhizophagus irregularis]|nr:15715_t:CDS:2 [Rhizophagus irregularis]
MSDTGNFDFSARTRFSLPQRKDRYQQFFLEACNDDPKLVELKQTYENAHYKKSINDYF